MKDKVYKVHPQLKDITQQVSQLTCSILEEFNSRSIKLFDLPAHKRIFLFIFTRTFKTFSAICTLCENGYGQDVSMLLRNLLENLITVKFILRDPTCADILTRRFVDYKWIIFKRNLPELGKNIHTLPAQEQKKFFQRKKMVLDHVAEFKQKYNIISDRALLTWSGKTVRDMASAVSKELLGEYDSTFRLCSRFSHPTILGDKEYMIQEDNKLVFSPFPTPIGIVPHTVKTVQFFLSFVTIVNDLFILEYDKKIRDLQKSFEDTSVLSLNPSPTPAPKDTPPIRESIVSFQIQPPQNTQT